MHKLILSCILNSFIRVFLAMRHGLNKKFSCKGIELMIEYFRSKHHTVMAFIPEYYLKYDKIGGLKRAATLGFEVSRARTPDDVSLLNRLVSSGDVIATPPQDYDDSYCIQYARSHNGCIVSNDMYRDAVKELKSGKAEKQELKQWLRTHCISYTFVSDEILPNPNFIIPKDTYSLS